MLRFTMLLLCLVLIGAAAGRFSAEAAVRETRSELRTLERQKAEETTRIQVLRAEVAYLERPERLATIADRMTELEPLSGAQLLTAGEFQVAFGRPDERSADNNSVAERPLEVADIGAAALR